MSLDRLKMKWMQMAWMQNFRFQISFAHLHKFYRSMWMLLNRWYANYIDFGYFCTQNSTQFNLIWLGSRKIKTARKLWDNTDCLFWVAKVQNSNLLKIWTWILRIFHRLPIPAFHWITILRSICLCVCVCVCARFSIPKLYTNIITKTKTKRPQL